MTTADEERLSLFLDTASKKLALELRKGRKYYRIALGDPKKSLERTHLGIAMALDAMNARLDEVKAFYCLLGPGSNTGIRLGLTIPRTLYAFDSTIQLYGIGTLALMLQEGETGYAALSDRNGNLFVAHMENGKVIEEKIEKKDFASLPEGLFLVEDSDMLAKDALKGRKVKEVDMLESMVRHKDAFFDYSKKEESYLPHYAFRI